jgi:hypothetical protein
MNNKERHQENLRIAHGIFYHGRYLMDGQTQPNKNKKRDEFLIRRRERIIYEANMPGLPRK